MVNVTIYSIHTNPSWVIHHTSRSTSPEEFRHLRMMKTQGPNMKPERKLCQWGRVAKPVNSRITWVCLKMGIPANGK